jgi:hypothetical protein
MECRPQILRLYGKKVLTIDHQNYVVNAAQNKEAATSTLEARARAVVGDN